MLFFCQLTVSVIYSSRVFVCVQLCSLSIFQNRCRCFHSSFACRRAVLPVCLSPFHAFFCMCRMFFVSACVARLALTLLLGLSSPIADPLCRLVCSVARLRQSAAALCVGMIQRSLDQLLGFSSVFSTANCRPFLWSDVSCRLYESIVCLALCRFDSVLADRCMLTYFSVCSVDYRIIHCVVCTCCVIFSASASPYQ